MTHDYTAMFAKNKALVQSLDEEEASFLYLELRNRVMRDEIRTVLKEDRGYYAKMFGVDDAHPVTDKELDKMADEYTFQLDDDIFGAVLARLRNYCIQEVLEDRIFR